MPPDIDPQVAAQLHDVEAVGERLAAPLSNDLEDVDEHDPLLSGSLGDKLVAALRQWKSGARLDSVGADLLKVMRAHGLEQGWTAGETSSAERKLRLLLRRVRQKNPEATHAVASKPRKRAKRS